MSKWLGCLAALSVVVALDLAVIHPVAAAEPEASPSPVYLVMEYEGLTRETNTRYSEMLAATLMPFKGRMLVQDAAPVSADPAVVANSVISIISFENANDLQTWVKSTFTQAMLQQREKKYKTRMITLEGRPPAAILVPPAKPEGQIRSELPK